MKIRIITNEIYIEIIIKIKIYLHNIKDARDKNCDVVTTRMRVALRWSLINT